MNEKIKQHLTRYCEGKGWPTDDEALATFLMETSPIYTRLTSHRRWWDEYFTVVDIGGLLIGFDGAHTTGDDSPQDKGWSFRPLSVCEVVKTQITVDYYEPAT